MPATLLLSTVCLCAVPGKGGVGRRRDGDAISERAKAGSSETAQGGAACAGGGGRARDAGSDVPWQLLRHPLHQLTRFLATQTSYHRQRVRRLILEFRPGVALDPFVFLEVEMLEAEQTVGCGR